MSAELEALLRTVRDFCRREVRALDIDQAHQLPKHLLEGLRELGLFGLTLPAEYGGAALPALDATRLVATLAEHDRSVATTVGLHLGLGTRGLVAYGSRAQHERWLPSLSSGEAIAAFATTEPAAGSDLSALETTARATADGGLTLQGTKLYVTNGALCSLLTVTALTPGLGGAARGMSMLLVDPRQRGVVRQSEERKLGLRGSSTTAFVFEDCALEPAAVLGEPGQGARQLAHVLSWGRLLLSAGCVGTARTALQLALAHVHTRRQFRRALIQQEVVQQQLSRAWAMTWAMHALVSRAATVEDDFAALARLTTSAKVFCSEAAGHVTDLALQLHGGSGYVEDTGLALLVRDARVTRIFEGANDVLLTHAGLSELTEPIAEPAVFGGEPPLDERAREGRAGGEAAGDEARGAPHAASDARRAESSGSDAVRARSTGRADEAGSAQQHAGSEGVPERRGRPGTDAAAPAALNDSLAAVWRAVRARRAALAEDESSPGLRALARRAEQHALGRAVVWRDAATAATLLARTPQEQAAARLIQGEALALATLPSPPRAPLESLTTALLEGLLP